MKTWQKVALIVAVPGGVALGILWAIRELRKHADLIDRLNLSVRKSS